MHDLEGIGTPIYGPGLWRYQIAVVVRDFESARVYPLPCRRTRLERQDYRSALIRPVDTVNRGRMPDEAPFRTSRSFIIGFSFARIPVGFRIALVECTSPVLRKSRIRICDECFE